MSSPAINAPTMGDRPTPSVASAATMTTRRLAERNSSGLLVRAACANSRRNAIRPTTINAATTNTPCHSARTITCQPPPAAWGAIAPSRKIAGTRARSSNSSMASAARPTDVRVPAIGRTNAVDDMASARPIPSAPFQCCPPTDSASASSRAEPMSSSAPRPKTCRRMAHSRSNESSSPTENSSRTMPNSAKGLRRAALVMVTAPSHGNRATSAPSPCGPTRMPTRMKPITGVMRKRAKTGMTIPAAPRITSASPRLGLTAMVDSTAMAACYGSGGRVSRGAWNCRHRRGYRPLTKLRAAPRRISRSPGRRSRSSSVRVKITSRRVIGSSNSSPQLSVAIQRI